MTEQTATQAPEQDTQAGEQAQPQAATQAAAETQPESDSGADGGVEVRDAQLSEATESGAAGGSGQLGVLLDSAMAVTASLGEVSVPVRELLQLGPGSVLKLDRLVGEPVDLLLGGVRFATGRVVVVGDRLGVRVEEITEAQEDGEAD